MEVEPEIKGQTVEEKKDSNPINSMPPDEQPINDNVWFKISREWVSNTDERIQKQVEKIQETIKWFFGLSTSATIIGFFLKEPSINSSAFWLYFLVILFMMLAYAISTLTTTTVSQSLDQPNDANKIRERFNSSNKWAKIFLVTSSISLFFGMALIAPAILSTFQSHSSSKKDMSFVSTYEIKKNGNEKMIKSIHISGYSDVAKSLIIQIDTGQDIKNSLKYTVFTQPLLRPEFNLIYPIGPDSSINATKTKVYISIGYFAKDTILSKKTIVKDASIY